MIEVLNGDRRPEEQVLEDDEGFKKRETAKRKGLRIDEKNVSKDGI